MNRLQKSAWFNLAFVTALVVVCGIVFGLMVQLNAPGGVVALVSFLIASFLSVLISFVIVRKKAIETKFDEREMKICIRAKLWSFGILILFLLFVCVGPFVFLGARADVPVYLLPMVFLGALFITQFAHSVVIIIRCILEDEDA